MGLINDASPRNASLAYKIDDEWSELICRLAEQGDIEDDYLNAASRVWTEMQVLATFSEPHRVLAMRYAVDCALL